MAMIIFLVFAAIWYLPVYFKQSKAKKLPVWRYIIALLLGALVAFPVSVILQILGEYALKQIPFISNNLKIVIKYFCVVALSEELLKLLCGRLALGDPAKCRKIDAILIFGAAGAGFEVIESIGLISSPVSAAVRGIFALHIIWQFWMGAYWWEASQCKLVGNKKGILKNRLIAVLVPLLFHGLHDTLSDFAAAYLEDSETDSKLIIGLTLFAAAFIIAIIFMIITINRTHRIAKDSAALETPTQLE